jgi:hypothetical protein
MERIKLGALIGLAVAAVGVTLIFGAREFATTWRKTGQNSWWGTSNKDHQEAYRLIGVAVLGLGFALETVAFHHWLSMRDERSDGTLGHEGNTSVTP